MDAPLFSDASNHQGVTILAVRPHPDDESTTTGGMLASYHAHGVRTGVVICTGGEEEDIHDPALDPVADMSRLREIREREVRRACDILGVVELRMLGYRDSGMADTPPNTHPEAFVHADPVEATGHLVRIIRQLRPRVIVTEPPGGLYGHPDHVACSRISVDAFHAAADDHAYPEAGSAWRVAKLYAVALIDDGRWEAFMPEFEAAGLDREDWKQRRQRKHRPGPEAATVALDVSAYSEDHRHALLAHHTQIREESIWVSMTAALRRRAFSTAYFIRLHPPAAPGKHEEDLLDGL